ncbi:MAG: efflux RND transporter periplasmic adaptor subunit [Myxococcales bacterium]|jgi:membrane fusion protein (multidrug efflux system)|nr:efflux RND transporter periplasmic adaptor subunit [Myxococcales bacterium]
MSDEPQNLEAPAAPPRRTSALSVVLTVVALVAIVATLAGIKGSQIGMLIGMGKQMEKDGPPPESVRTQVAKADAWETTVPSVGNVVTVRGVAVSNDVPGVVKALYFDSGKVVKQGELLAVLDSSVEQAQLASAKSRVQLAQVTYDRSQALAKTSSIPQAQLDADEAQLRTTKTDIAAIEAQIAKKSIRAPFAGKLGIRTANLGQYLAPGTPLTVLESQGSGAVDFSIPQKRLPELALGLPVRITLPGGPPIVATVSAVEPTVDAASRSIKVRATFTSDAKTEALLRPGMFVNVAVVLPTKVNVVVVPRTAVVSAPYGDSVFAVEDKKPEETGLRQTSDGKPVRMARQRFVKLGEARGDFVAVLNGLAAGTEVVSSGAFKLQNNAPVYLTTATEPSPEENPHPVER